MSSKYARLSIVTLALVLGGCTGSGAATQAPSPVAAGTLRATLAPTASPTTEPVTSPSASSGGVTGGQLTPSPIDPCSLMTAAEASQLDGVTLGAGTSTVVGSLRVCTFAAGTTEVKIFLAALTDPAAAQAYYDTEKAQVPAEFQVTDLPGFFDRAAIGRTSAVSISGIFVLDGSNFFELYCGLPACSDDALKSGATLIGGRLP
jgi:hypothetical protein